MERLSEFLAVLLGRLFDLDNLSVGGEGEGSCLHAQLLVDEGPECGRGLGELLVEFLGVIAELFDIALPGVYCPALLLEDGSAVDDALSQVQIPVIAALR